jgi:hypothetical protein
MAEKLSVTLEGTVDRIIPPLFPNEPEKVQISVETHNSMYREVRVENKLTDENGGKVSLKLGSPVAITITAEDTSTTAESSVPISEESPRTP